MSIESVGAAIATLLTSFALTYVVYRAALRHGVLDVPNARSSHDRPTPRGGGIAIVISATAGFAALWLLDALRFNVACALAGGGLLVAVTGFLDDRRGLPAGLRLAVHLIAAAWAIGWLEGLPPLQVGKELHHFGWAGHVLGILGITWVLNLFNFMDGIDGIAAVEASFIAAAGAVLALATSGGIAAAGWCVSAASLGFLFWNWPPARVFMGDVGSGYLGFVVAVLAIAAAKDNPVALLSWLCLGALFFVDASLTLARRVVRGEAVLQPHRTHAYQWLARRWGGHLPVTLLVLVIDCLWLLPLAWYANHEPERAWLVAIIALAPLVVLAWIVGAGQPEGIRSAAKH